MMLFQSVLIKALSHADNGCIDVSGFRGESFACTIFAVLVLKQMKKWNNIERN